MKFKTLLVILFAALLFSGCANSNTADNGVDRADGPTDATDKLLAVNIAQTKHQIDNQVVINKLSGYLVYKTISCIFRTSNPPKGEMYAPSPCAPDTGYVVLSESGKSLSTDPVTEKTVLNENQILIYNIPDLIIEKLQFGEIYTFKGASKQWNGFNAVKYLGVTNLIDCDEIKKEVIASYKEVNYCQQDADCVYKPNLGFEKGCDRSYNKNADLEVAKEKEKLFFDARCSFPEISCLSPEEHVAKCKEGECILEKKN